VFEWTDWYGHLNGIQDAQISTYVAYLVICHGHREKAQKLTTTMTRLETIFFVELTKKFPVFYREGYLLTIITNTYHHTLHSAT